MSSPFVRVEEKNALRLIYFRKDGSAAIYLGGTRGWRNNNPGNISYGNGKLVKALGAIGKAGGFAIFASYEIGRKAIFSVLKKSDFQQRSVAKAIEVWAPKKDKNDPEKYKKQIQLWTNIDLNRKIQDLADSEMESLVNAIERKEGGGKGRVGRIIEIPASKAKGKKEISCVKKNKKGTIVEYYVEAYGWLTKDQAVEMASLGQIDVVIATSRSGNVYLRTRPDIEVVNLEDLG